jgi:hypothetical protein
MRFHEFEIDLISKMNEDIGVNIIPDIKSLISIDLYSIVSFRQTYQDSDSTDQPSKRSNGRTHNRLPI